MKGLLRKLKVTACICSVVFVMQACSLNDLVSGSALPANVKDPKALKNPTGAIALYHEAVISFTNAIGGMGAASAAAVSSIVSVSGLLTDELQLVFSATSPLAFPTTAQAAIDSRTIPTTDVSAASSSAMPYSSLHSTRASSSEAIGALQKYAPDTTAVRVGHLFSLKAASEVLLAEMYCSGIPLSELLFEQDYVLSEAKSTEDVLRHALKLVDSALVYASGDQRVENLARVTQGRALLALGNFTEAAEAVSLVPTTYKYDLLYSATERNFFVRGTSATSPWVVTVGDRKGINGLLFVTGDDPRTATTPFIAGINFPQKYASTGVSPITFASGVEARLIEAEAALHQQDANNWLNILNQLRSSGIASITPRAGEPSIVDTTWLVGAGGVLFEGRFTGFPGLRPLQDPGTDSGRVSLHFQERAAWLFLTGHRLGDLRRLVRQYNREPEDVFPTGDWGPLKLTIYGPDVNIPVPAVEEQRNNLYRGCLSREA